MAVSLKHLKTSFVSDSGDPSLVQGSDWNAEHNLTCASGVLLGRQTAGAGAAEEVPIADFWASPGAIGGTTPAAGTFTTLTANSTAAFGKGSANYLQANGAATTKTPIYSVAGSDANIALAFQSKGTGGIDLAPGSAGVNISNGGTVTAVTRTATGASYTSFPSVTISAPTTPGGTTAQASVAQMVNSTATIQSGGTGYSVNDVLTLVGGTPASLSGTYTVTSVSGGIITGLSTTTQYGYTSLPTNPVSVTGGTGTGATINVSWVISSLFTITNPGSGYLEQPQITFSGGGGSGAAAYATVGSNPVIKGLAGVLNVATSGGINFAVVDSGLNPPNTYPYATGGTGSAGFGVISTVSNAGVTFASKGTSAVDFYTNSYGSLGLRVSHTASAVNYMQVTGAATGGAPTLSLQGSDANILGQIHTKGNGSFNFYSYAGANRQVRIDGASASVNYLDLYGSVASSPVAIKTNGTDTNIDLALTPKGTGVVQFGAHTATADTAISGYITIKDAGGTTRKLAVIT